jgi:hypothetical protein
MLEAMALLRAAAANSEVRAGALAAQAWVVRPAAVLREATALASHG